MTFFTTGLTALKKGCYQVAKTNLKDGLAECPEDPCAWHALGLVYVTEKKYARAYECFKKALAYDAQDRKKWFDAGNAARILKRFSDARYCYEQALSLRADFAEAWGALATVSELLGALTEAKAYYQRSLSLKAAQPETWYNFGRYYFKQKQFDQAQYCFVATIELRPEDSKAYFQLGLIACQNETWSDAEKYFLSVLEQIPNDLESLNNLGVIALKKNNAQLAVHYFGQVLLERSDHIEARENIAAVFFQENRFKQAITHYEALLSYAPDNQQAQFNLGCAYMTMGDLDKARRLFFALEKTGLDKVDLLINLGLLAKQKEAFDEAKCYFERVLAKQPDHRIVRYHLDLLIQRARSTIPIAYIEHLFNNYAFYYDKHLIDVLKYAVPDQIQAFCKAKQLYFECLLDLGCGTGLIGERMIPFSKVRTGVDISEKMVMLARRKGYYQSLHVSTIDDFLKQVLPCCYDAVVSGDVFNYIGDLQAILYDAARCLVSGGCLIFSTEGKDLSESYRLQLTGRFVHSKQYIEACIAETNQRMFKEDEMLTLFAYEEIILREQETVPVWGALFCLKKAKISY